MNVRRRRRCLVVRSLDDATSATVAAVDGGGPGIYNVVGDEPAPVREWLPFLAEQPGAAQADEGPPGPPHRGSAAGRRGRSGQTGLTP